MTILDAGRVMAIIRYRSSGDLDAVAATLADATIPLIEITLDTPGALDAIARLAGAGYTIGAGTVLSQDEVRASADAGARFVVSPAVIPDVIETAHDAGVEPIAGALTPSEIREAIRAGCVSVKIFPAGPIGGAAYIAALRGPFPSVGLLPTGGIGVDDIGPLLAAGATCVGIGTALIGSEPPASSADLDAMGVRAAAAMQIQGR